MRFTQSAFLAVAAAPLLAFAQGTSESNGSNPFSIPTESLNTEAGETVDLKWDPTTEGTVTIYLRSGASNDLNKGVAIASNIDNSGSFTWSVPEDIVRGSNYALEIVDDSNDENTNYTPPFVIESDNNAAPSVSSSASASATESDSSSTASETESATETDTESSATSTDASSSTTAASSASVTNSSNSSSTMTTSSRTGSSSATSTSDSDDSQEVTPSEGGAARTSAFAGLIGLVAFGAFML